MDCYLGIDVGTSGTKTLLMNARGRVGRVLATATAAHTVESPRPLWSEQDPRQWWAATVKAVRQVVKAAGVKPEEVRCAGFSGQMHGLVCLDGRGEPLRPAILWNDQRTAEQCREITEAAGGPAGLIKRCGNVAMTSFTLTKLLWVRRHEPKLYRRMACLLLPKDYVRYRMTARLAGDVSDMSGTMLLDQRRRDWSEEMTGLFEVDRGLLPELYESHQVAGTLTAEAAAELGLAEGMPVVAGGGDQPVGAVGNGIVEPQRVSATLGTSGVVYIHSSDYVTDPAGAVQTFCASVAGQYCLFGCVLAAGGSLQWLRNTLGSEEVARAKAAGGKLDPYDLLMRGAKKAAPGCEGLFWLPYLTGERTPHNDPAARACWIGLSARTGRNELIRSVIEGATFAMADVLKVLRGRGLSVRQVRLSGGGARSAFWRQLQADIYNADCATINAQEGPAFGAAILAAVGDGAYPDVPAACEKLIRVRREIRPDPKAAALYERHHAQYRRLYPALKDEFPALAELS